MFTKEQIAHPLYWVARYENGDRIEEYSLQHPEGMSTENLSRVGLRKFALIDLFEAAPVFSMDFKPGSKFIFRRHVQMQFVNSWSSLKQKFFYQVAQVFANGEVLNCVIDCSEKKLLQIVGWGDRFPLHQPVGNDAVASDEFIIT